MASPQRYAGMPGMPDMRDRNSPVHDMKSQMTGSMPAGAEQEGVQYVPVSVEHNLPGFSGWFLAMIFALVITGTWPLPYRWSAMIPILGLCLLAGLFVASHWPTIYMDGTVKKNSNMGIGVFIVLFLVFMVAFGSAISTPTDLYEGQHINEVIVSDSAVYSGQIVNISVRLGQYTNEPVQIELSIEHASGFHMTRLMTIQKSVIGTTSVEAPGQGSMVIKARPVGVTDWEQEITVKILPHAG